MLMLYSQGQLLISVKFRNEGLGWSVVSEENVRNTTRKERFGKTE